MILDNENAIRGGITKAICHYCEAHYFVKQFKIIENKQI